MPKPPLPRKITSSGISHALRVKPARGLFRVSDDYLSILDAVYAAVQRTELWESVRGSCFCLAGFVRRVFAAQGRDAVVLPCYAECHNDDRRFLLGYNRMSCAPEQVDGHVVTLVDHTILVDFGLRNVQRYAWPDFPGAVAIEVPAGKPFPTELVVGLRRKIVWKDDWVYPDTEKLLAKHAPVIERLYDQYSAQR